MGTGTKGDTRVDLDQDVILIFFFVGFPGWLDHNVVSGTERLEESLPVVDPVLVLCFRQADGAFSDVAKLFYFLKNILHLHHDLFRVAVFRLHIKMHFGSAVVILRIRQDVHKHFLFIFFGQRYMILNLNSFHTDLVQHIT